MRWFRRGLTGLASITVLLAFPGDGASQNVYADQVQGYLDQLETRALDSSYSLEGRAAGWMMDGAEGGTLVWLPAGSYIVLGACDDDCSDIDLVVRRVDNQKELGADRELDSFPIAEFSIAEASEVLIGISMPDCDTARCYAGYRWYSREAATAPPGDVTGWEEQVRIQLEALPTPDVTTLVEERSGLVGAGEAERFSLTLEPGTYGGVAVCDYDCSDVDLLVYAVDGTMLASDVLEDDVPIVEIEVPGTGGPHTFEVRMVDCSTASCGYGFRLYRQEQD